METNTLTLPNTASAQSQFSQTAPASSYTPVDLTNVDNFSVAQPQEDVSANPKKKSYLKIGAALAGAAAVIGGLYYMFRGGGNKGEVAKEAVKEGAQAVKESVPTAAAKTERAASETVAPSNVSIFGRSDGPSIFPEIRPLPGATTSPGAVVTGSGGSATGGAAPLPAGGGGRAWYDPRGWF